MQNAAWGVPSTGARSKSRNSTWELASETSNGLLSRRAAEIRTRAVQLGILEDEDDHCNISVPDRRIKSCLSIEKETANGGVKKTVSFHSVEIREHPRTLGDNPSVSNGPPLALDWYDEESGNSVFAELDEYEESRLPHRRSLNDLCLPSSERNAILKEEVGVTMRELVKACQEVSKIKRMRRQTNAAAHTEQTQVFVESMGRKFQRLVGKKASTKQEIKELWERAAAANNEQPSFPRVASMPAMPSPTIAVLQDRRRPSDDSSLRNKI